MKRVCLWEPMNSPEKQEPFAELKYADVTFEIPYTLMHWIAGWLAMGMHGTTVSVKVLADTKKAIDYIESVMGYDANLPSDNGKIFYVGHGIPCKRPELKWEA